MPRGYRWDGEHHHHHPDFFCTLARDQWLYAGGNGWTLRTVSVFRPAVVSDEGEEEE